VNKFNVRKNVNDLSVQINRWRKFRKLSQRELEAMANLGNNSISRIEKSQVSPRIETVEKIARALELSVEELQFRVPPKAEDEFLNDELNRLIERLGSLDEKKQSSLIQAFHQLLDLIEQ
jgi:transcriptional regulator with XRE-family HTH domain